MTPYPQLDDSNSMLGIDIMEQSIFSVHGSSIFVPKRPDCGDANMNAEMGVVQTRHAEMHDTRVLCGDNDVSSSVNMPSERNDEDNSNLDLESEGSKADLERERGIADVEAGCSDVGNHLPLSQKQNHTTQAKSLGQDDFGQCASFGDRVCRVCYLGRAAQAENGPAIELGCECKLDLAIAHRQCAEAWFDVKGDRTCEICGKTVHNVDGIGDAIFMENWNDAGVTSGMLLRAAHWWQSHRLSNVLLAIMVLAFVLLHHLATPEGF